MKKIIFIIILIVLTNNSFAAGSSDGKGGLLKSGEKLIAKAKKLEKKGKTDKALKLKQAKERYRTTKLVLFLFYQLV